ncbi:hypothetical protein RFI_11219 [Reticulomyxa filosa]|uniref:protein-serine/threonine phosphatase n=1 Tax=Reticulomyxa filosa TaxID=46433 RepID=X6NJ51_RETFI|nr:hypothetical protein RFI_11219 [Reticulomyxa filosa]|eukprot:ETO25918.1 hypothetical protein RFI_11219 [Reticulomyxa filosa]
MKTNQMDRIKVALPSVGKLTKWEIKENDKVEKGQRIGIIETKDARKCGLLAPMGGIIQHLSAMPTPFSYLPQGTVIAYILTNNMPGWKHHVINPKYTLFSKYQTIQQKQAFCDLSPKVFFWFDLKSKIRKEKSSKKLGYTFEQVKNELASQLQERRAFEKRNMSPPPFYLNTTQLKIMTSLFNIVPSNNNNNNNYNNYNYYYNNNLQNDLVLTNKEKLELRTQQLHNMEKLVLVLDLDHTLVHATRNPRAAELMSSHTHPVSPFKDSIHQIIFTQPNKDGKPQLQRYWIKERPHLRTFLNVMRKHFKLAIYTMGIRAYAHEVLKVIDPTEEIFKQCMITRETHEEMCNTSENKLKRLSNLIVQCEESMILIVDDMPKMWMTPKHVIQVPKFEFFPPEIEEDDDRDNDNDDNDDDDGGENNNNNNNRHRHRHRHRHHHHHHHHQQQQQQEQSPFYKHGTNNVSKDPLEEEKWGLPHLLQKNDCNILLNIGNLLQAVHRIYYYSSTQFQNNSKKSLSDYLISCNILKFNDCSVIYEKMKEMVFENCVVTFSGLMSNSLKHYEDDEMWRLIKTHGGTCVDHLNDKVTHLVCRVGMTQQVGICQSRFPHVKIVHWTWIYQSVHALKALDTTLFHFLNPPNIAIVNICFLFFFPPMTLIDPSELSNHYITRYGLKDNQVPPYLSNKIDVEKICSIRVRYLDNLWSAEDSATQKEQVQDHQVPQKASTPPSPTKVYTQDQSQAQVQETAPPSTPEKELDNKSMTTSSNNCSGGTQRRALRRPNNNNNNNDNNNDNNNNNNSKESDQMREDDRKISWNDTEITTGYPSITDFDIVADIDNKTPTDNGPQVGSESSSETMRETEQHSLLYAVDTVADSQANGNDLQTWENIVKFFAQSFLKSSAANGQKWVGLKDVYEHLCRHSIDPKILESLKIFPNANECKCLQEIPHFVTKISNGELWFAVDEDEEIAEGNKMLLRHIQQTLLNHAQRIPFSKDESRHKGGGGGMVNTVGSVFHPATPTASVAISRPHSLSPPSHLLNVPRANVINFPIQDADMFRTASLNPVPNKSIRDMPNNLQRGVIPHTEQRRFPEPAPSMGSQAEPPPIVFSIIAPGDAPRHFPNSEHSNVSRAPIPIPSLFEPHGNPNASLNSNLPHHSGGPFPHLNRSAVPFSNNPRRLGRNNHPMRRNENLQKNFVRMSINSDDNRNRYPNNNKYRHSHSRSRSYGRGRGRSHSRGRSRSRSRDRNGSRNRNHSQGRGHYQSRSRSGSRDIYHKKQKYSPHQHGNTNRRKYNTNTNLNHNRDTEHHRGAGANSHFDEKNVSNEIGIILAIQIIIVTVTTPKVLQRNTEKSGHHPPLLVRIGKKESALVPNASLNMATVHMT